MAFVAPVLPPRTACARASRAPARPRMSAGGRAVSRRAALVAGAAAAAGVVLPAVAADVQPYSDIAKGFSLLRPSGWNEFDSSEGQYDVKWQDVIQPLEFVTVLTTPVTKGKPLSALGTAEEVGERLASGRGGTLVAAREYTIDDIPAYALEIKKPQAHQITVLTIAKSKLYSLNACASEKRWDRREKLLRQVADSFKPKL